MANKSSTCASDLGAEFVFESSSTKDLQMISIRLDKDLIESYQLLAEARHKVGYQPLMREVLKAFVEHELHRVGVEALKEKVKREKLQDSRRRTSEVMQAA